MVEFYFTAPLDNERTLCLAPLTDRKIAMSGENLADTSGYFLFEKSEGDDLAGVKIIAQVVSEEAALKLRDMFNMA